MLCKATGIFMNFSVIFIWLFEGLKLKQFLKQLNRKKRKKRFQRRTELGRSRPSRPQSTRACAAHQEAQPLAAASSFPSLFLFLCFFPWRVGPLVSASSTSTRSARIRYCSDSESTKIQPICCGFSPNFYTYLYPITSSSFSLWNPTHLRRQTDRIPHQSPTLPPPLLRSGGAHSHR
jgi:hypothetical protein